MAQMTQVGKTFNPISFVIIGTIFWFDALLFIRFGGESLFIDGNPWLLLLYVASIPIAWISIEISAIIGKIARKDLLNAVAIMALTALLLDGVALTWFPSWYGLAPTGLLLAAAWLLWGVGISLGIGYWASHSHQLDC